ncbi:MAG: hypothetical protein AABX29_03105 [Nanoarchaeota archaeon]
MVNGFRKIIFLGLILIVIHAVIFLTFDFNSYFIFALLSILVYAVYISDEIRKKDEGNLKQDIARQKEIDRSLKERIEKQNRLLKLYRKRLDQLYIEVAEKSKVVLEEKKTKEIKILGYVGSNKNRTYHKAACRFGKLIKQKEKITSDNVGFFRKKRFSACKVCMKN